MDFIREHKKISITILIIAILLLLFGTTFARYIYNTVHNHILESKEFYFYSTVLDMNNKQYKINNWDGVNNYTLTIDVTSKKNSLKSTNMDIKYKTEINCPSTVECQLSKTDGVIYKTSKTDSYQITIIPKQKFHEGDEITINTKAISTSPYVKELSATYTIGIEKSNFSYNIEDDKNEKLLNLNLTNSVTYYKVEKAFGSYQVGDKVSREDYRKLSDSDKEKCFSAKVTIAFPPKELHLDMTNKNYLRRLSNSEKIEKINGFNYVSGFSFKMDASSSEKILFYKQSPEKDYTYPVINETPIITVTVETAQ